MRTRSISNRYKMNDNLICDAHFDYNVYGTDTKLADQGPGLKDRGLLQRSKRGNNCKYEVVRRYKALEQAILRDNQSKFRRPPRDLR